MSIAAVRRHRWLVLSAAAAYSMSTLFSAMKPILLTRFVEQHGWSNALAGLAVAMPFAGIAIAALCIAPLTRLSLRRLAVVFGAVLVTAELGSALGHASAAVVLALQFSGGFAVGILMGASSRIIATTDLAGPLFGAVDMIAVLLMSAMVAIVGTAVGYGGLTGGYLVAAVIGALLAVAMLPYKNPALITTASTATLVVSVRALAVVAMGVIFVTCSGLGFTYMFTVAQELGIGYADAGRSIGLLLFVSAFVCLLGGWASARYGPYRPLAIAFIACAGGWYGVVHAPSPVVFYASLVPAVFALQFNFPVLLDLAGSLDRTGRWGAIAAPLQTSGFAWAAILAGLIVGRFGLDALPKATAIGMLVCLCLLAVASRRRTAAESTFVRDDAVSD
ncbi:MAG: MFS transporter [Pseudomonadota bacterium]